MSDRKSYNKKSSARRKGPRQGYAKVPSQIPTDTMVIRTTFTSAALSSGTDGSVSSSIGASIQSASEYSVLASLFREVKLLAQEVSFFFYYPYVNSGTNQATTTFICGTDMRMNGTTYTPPTQYLDVYNLTDRRKYCRTNPKEIIFRRRVPPKLEHTNIADDCPTLPIPYAGSPGVVQIFSAGNVVSSQLTTILTITATYHLQGRV